MSDLTRTYDGISYSLLNTEIFNKSIYYGLSTKNNDFRVAAYLLLQTMPVELFTSKKLIGRLKTHAAVHQIPYPYMLWIGANYFAYKNPKLINSVKNTRMVGVLKNNFDSDYLYKYFNYFEDISSEIADTGNALIIDNFFDRGKINGFTREADSANQLVGQRNDTGHLFYNVKVFDNTQLTNLDKFKYSGSNIDIVLSQIRNRVINSTAAKYIFDDLLEEGNKGTTNILGGVFNVDSPIIRELTYRFPDDEINSELYSKLFKIFNKNTTVVSSDIFSTIDSKLMINLVPFRGDYAPNSYESYILDWVVSDKISSEDNDKINKFVNDNVGKTLFYDDFTATNQPKSIIEMIRAIPIHTLETCEEEFIKFVNNESEYNTYNFKSLLFALTTITSDDLVSPDKTDINTFYNLVTYSFNKQTLIRANTFDYIKNVIRLSQAKKINDVLDGFMSFNVHLSIATVLDAYTPELTLAFFKDDYNTYGTDMVTYLDYLINITNIEYSNDTYVTNQDYLADFGLYILSSEESQIMGVNQNKIATAIKDDFFGDYLGLTLTKSRLKLLANFIRLALHNISNTILAESNVLGLVIQQEFTDIIQSLVIDYKQNANLYLNGFKVNLNEIQEEQLELKEESKNDLDIAKFKTYYNVKDIFDRWISFDLNAKDKFFNTRDVEKCSNQYQILYDSDKDLIDYFTFVDRANRDVSDKFVVNLDFLNEILTDNLQYSNNEKINMTLYKFIDLIASNHNFIFHSLPAFTQIDSFDVDSAKSLFRSFDHLEQQETTPAFVLQYAGDNATTLFRPDDTTIINDKRQSFCLDIDTDPEGANSIELPEDIANGNVVSFIVEYGDKDQSFFKNLELDQSEFQNTEESYDLIVGLVNDKAKVASANLYDFYTSRSYSATISTLGNMSIQPLMFFYLKGVPMFYGSYWITNVTHTIQNNQMETRFKGVRQPISTLPTTDEITIESIDEFLTNLKILPKEAIKTTEAATPEDIVKSRSVTSTEDKLPAAPVPRTGISNSPFDIVSGQTIQPNNIYDEIYRKITYADMKITEQTADNSFKEVVVDGELYTVADIKQNINYILTNAYYPLIRYLQNKYQVKIRESLITSAYRNTVVNGLVHGAANSRHLIGSSMDISTFSTKVEAKYGISNFDVQEFFLSDRFKTGKFDANGNPIYYFNFLQKYPNENNRIHIDWYDPTVKGKTNQGIVTTKT